ncbi:MAG: TIGR00701 family protein [Proteobacteria bacterium]|nr:TIGR00701 family protein [Pseudomonadota bacterium]RZO98916.1 MAG: protoporphyrinogen oxidase HemJ [Gammaproteobacteria bacterium]
MDLIYLTLKVVHIVAVIAWMAALFYLPRLFVYHAKHNDEKLLSSVFKVMESRLYGVIANPAMVVVWLSGIYLVYVQGNQFWLNLKIFFVFLMTLYHFFLFYSLKRFKDDLNDYSERFFRIINEVPTVLVIIIVGLVVFKPNL